MTHFLEGGNIPTMPVPPSEKEKSHEDLIASSKLSLKSWDSQRRTYVNRRAFVLALPELMKKLPISNGFFLDLGKLGSKILVVPESDHEGVSGRGQIYSSIVKSTYPLEFKEATIEISDNHETIKFTQEGTEPQEIFTAHLGDRNGVVFDLVQGQTLPNGIHTPSPLRVVLERVSEG